MWNFITRCCVYLFAVLSWRQRRCRLWDVWTVSLEQYSSNLQTEGTGACLMSFIFYVLMQLKICWIHLSRKHWPSKVLWLEFQAGTGFLLMPNDWFLFIRRLLMKTTMASWMNLWMTMKTQLRQVFLCVLFRLICLRHCSIPFWFEIFFVRKC